MDGVNRRWAEGHDSPMTSAPPHPWAAAGIHAPADLVPHAPGVAIVPCGRPYPVRLDRNEAGRTIRSAYEPQTLVHCAPEILMHGALRNLSVLRNTNIGTSAAHPVQKSGMKRAAYGKNGTTHNKCTY